MRELVALLGKKNIVLTSSCNKAILEALKIAKERGYTKLFLADSGSWITYAQFGKKLKFEIEEVKTQRGVIDFSKLKDGVVLFHDLAAYAFLQRNYDYELLKQNNVFVIADVCGSIGQRVIDSDLTVCSFGREQSAKILDAGYGGCIASDFPLLVKSDYEGDESLLKKAIYALPDRIKQLKQLRDQVLSEIEGEIIVPDEEGFNVYVKDKFESVINYCESHEIAYRKCPMKTRILEDAISIEIKAKRF